MKLIFKSLAIVFLVMGLSNSAKATHLMGGEITAIQLHDSTYLITLTTYRDTLGIPMDSIANFVVRNTSGVVVKTFSIPYDSVISGSTLRLYPYGVEIYLFMDTIHLPDTGTFHISFEDCCRNGAIQNLTKPLSESMYLTTTVTYFGSAKNSTPFFLVQPVIFLPRNTSWAYNPLPFDLDGDSLVWSLDTPLTDFNVPCAGYTAPPSTSTGPFTLNASTGSISWTASTAGNFDATVLVEEYRNGVKIGEIRRDMQFIVVNPVGSMAMMTNMNELPQDSKNNYHVSIEAKTSYMFSFYAEDPDTGDVVSMLAFGEPFQYPQGQRAAFFVIKTGKTYGNEMKGTFVWKPDVAMVREKPYIVVYRVSDGFNTLDYSVLYTVEGPGTQPPITGIGDIENEPSISLYPNPAMNVINLDIKLNEGKDVQMEVYSITGQKKFTSQLYELEVGNHLVSQQLDLPSGMYIVTVKSTDELLYHNKLQIVK